MTTAAPFPGCACTACERRRAEGAFLAAFTLDIEAQTRALRRGLAALTASRRRFPLSPPQHDADPSLGCRRWMPEPG